ncbi:hypothetical protein DVH24_029038 [Malus domestica]|uniref:AB hydrolase-1 domain-containing protein n=1 Tax=Malus domestica TaxID=3750 RepID=A0A498HXM2_MALDO|nr:hypothetical protein DVH24_029038 [Malus domestica]
MRWRPRCSSTLASVPTSPSPSTFTEGLNYYRALNLTWELTGPYLVAYWTMDEPTDQGGFKRDVPFMQEVVVMEDAAHFINQEKPDELKGFFYALTG